MNFLSTTDSCEYATLEAYDEDMAMISTGTLIDYLNDWIIDSGCLNHMTGDVKKFRSTRPYEGNRVVVTSDNSQHPLNILVMQRLRQDLVLIMRCMGCIMFLAWWRIYC